MASAVQSKAELIVLEAAAYPTMIENQIGLESQLIQDIVDTVIPDQVIKTSNYTVVINAGDSGKSFVSALDGMVFTLPAIAIGNDFEFENTGADGAAKLSISPNSADGITYLGAESDDSDLINTKTTALKGDKVTIASFTAVVTWQVPRVRGIWAKG